MVRRSLLLAMAVALVGVTMVSYAAAQDAPKAKIPEAAMENAKETMSTGITGNWMLMSRELADGTKQMAPDVSGMLTYTTKYRNFNVMYKDAAGENVTISYVAEYKLTPTEYSETPLMWVMTNEAGPEKVTYTPSPDKGKPAPVTMKDGSISFAVPGEPPVITFKGDEMTAVAEGQFVDHWKRVGGK